MCLVCATAAAGTIATVTAINALKRRKFKPYLYRVYLGPLFWANHDVGYVYAKSWIGIYLKKIFHVPFNSGPIECRNNAGNWEVK